MAATIQTQVHIPEGHLEKVTRRLQQLGFPFIKGGWIKNNPAIFYGEAEIHYRGKDGKVKAGKAIVKLRRQLKLLQVVGEITMFDIQITS